MRILQNFPNFLRHDTQIPANQLIHVLLPTTISVLHSSFAFLTFMVRPPQATGKPQPAIKRSEASTSRQIAPTNNSIPTRTSPFLTRHASLYASKVLLILVPYLTERPQANTTQSTSRGISNLARLEPRTAVGPTPSLKRKRVDVRATLL